MILDTSEFKNIKLSERKTVNMLIGGSLEKVKANTFRAKFKGPMTVTVSVHDDIKKKVAFKTAKLFSEGLGRVPAQFRKSLKHLHITNGKERPSNARITLTN